VTLLHSTAHFISINWFSSKATTSGPIRSQRPPLMVPPAVPYIINGGQGGGCRGRGHWTVSSFITVCNQCPLTTVKGFPRRHRQVPVMTSRQGFTRLSVSLPAVGDVGTATASTRIRIDEHEWRLLNNWLHVCSGVTRAIGARRHKQWSSPRQKKLK